VPLLGERQQYEHCGTKVKKPKAADAFLCPSCGKPGPWASQDQIRQWETWERARGQYHLALTGVIDGSAVAAQELAQLAPLTGMSEIDLFSERVHAFVEAANQAIGDQILTPDENRYLYGLLGALGISWDDTDDVDPMLQTKAFVSAINGGILPEVAEPHVLPKKGEIVHFEVAANLMKEVALKEYRGGYSGFSIPIGKTGVRYRVGGVRGRMVQVGTQLQVADTGLLAVTNKRAVYMGSRKTIDMPLAKLINLNVFTDGVQFQMSNRVNPPLFQTDQSEIVAALVNAAAQRLE
jgi:hypothetical protein